MGFLRKLSNLFAGRSDSEDNRHVHREFVRCSRCGEMLEARVDLGNDLTPTYDEGEGAFYARKGVVGSGKTRCFQTIEVELYFDSERNLVSRYVTGGEFVSREDYLADIESAQSA